MELNSVSLGEGAGDYESVSKEVYDEVYEDLKNMLEKEGPAAVLAYKKRCWDNEPGISPRRKTMVITMVKELPGAEVHLCTAEETNSFFTGQALSR